MFKEYADYENEDGYRNECEGDEELDAEELDAEELHLRGRVPVFKVKNQSQSTDSRSKNSPIVIV